MIYIVVLEAVVSHDILASVCYSSWRNVATPEIYLHGYPFTLSTASSHVVLLVLAAVQSVSEVPW